MAKQTINLGTPNGKDGDIIRDAFNKVNQNFTELYTLTGGTAAELKELAQDYAADMFTNGTHVGITVTYDDDNNKLNLSVPAGFSGAYADLTGTPTIPADISELTDSTGLLSGGTGDITFAATTISAPNEAEVVVQSKDINGLGTARVTLNSLYGGNARLEAFSNESVDTFTLANSDFATGVWQDNGFGNGVVSFTGAQGIGDFFQNTLFKLTADNVTISINGETPFVWNGGASGAGTDTPGFGTNPIVPATPITITSIEFRYRSESFISVNYDNQEIRLDAQNAGIRMDSGNDFQIFGDSRIELQSTTGMSLSAGEDINIGTSSSYAVSISTGDFTVNAFDDIRIEGRDSFRLINSSAIAPIRIITNDDTTPRTWAFNPNGTITFPDSTIQTTAFLGNGDITFDGVKIQGAGTASGDGLGYATIELVPDTNLYANNQYIVVDPTGGEPGHIHLRAGGTQDASGADLYLGGELTCVRVSDTSGHVTIRTTNVGDPNITMDWRFETDGNLYFPGIGNNRIGESEPRLVVSSSDAVVLQSNNNGESKEILFGTDGILYLPSIGSGGGAILRSPLNESIGISAYNDTGAGSTYTLSVATTGPINIPTASTGLGRLQNADGIEILTNSGETAKLWAFNDDGSLTLPNDGVISAGGSGGLTLGGLFDVKIVADYTDNNRTWTFNGADGSITFPDNTVQETAYPGPQTTLVGAVDNNVLIRTSETVVTNNLYTNTTDFVTDIDPSLGFVISGWSQRNDEEIELNLFVPALGSFYTFLTELLLGRTVTVTYSTAGGNQTFTSTLSQVFAPVAQFDPVTGWQRIAGRILGTLPVDQTGIVSINFPVTTTPQRDWTFSDTGSLTFPDGTTTVGKTIVVPAEEDFNITLQHDFLDGAGPIPFSFSVSYDRITLPNGNGKIFTGSTAGNNEWALDAANKNLFFPNGDLILYNGSVAEEGSDYGLHLFTYTKPVVITSGQTKSWTFDIDGNLTLPGELHGAPVMSVGPTPSQVGRTVNITPADDADDKKFRFRIDQYAGQTFTRAYLELPAAEVDKQVAAVFPHANGKAGYIFTQGADTIDDGLNNAFNVFYNAGDIKLTAMTPVTGTLNTWKFGSDGSLTFPDATVQTTAFTGNAATVDITNTNGIDTNYSITFVETRDATQILRADVDLTFNSATNLLTTGNVAIKQTLTGGMDDGSDFIITSQPNPDRNNASNIGIYPGGATGTASESGFVLIQGGGSDVVGLAGGNVIIRGGAHTNSGVSGTIKVESVLKIDDGVHEKFQTKSNATGTVTHDCSSGHIFYHTLPSANWTVNLTNLNLAVGYATTVTLVIEQGATGYYPNAIQIDGNGIGIAWQGNTSPTPSSSRIDVVTFSILYDGLYTVLGQLTGF